MAEIQTRTTEAQQEIYRDLYDIVDVLGTGALYADDKIRIESFPTTRAANGGERIKVFLPELGETLVAHFGCWRRTTVWHRSGHWEIYVQALGIAARAKRGKIQAEQAEHMALQFAPIDDTHLFEERQVA